MEESKKSKGAKLSRSETLSIRLDPRLRYLAELGARIERRSISSFLEWALQDYLKRTPIAPENIDSPTVMDRADSLWEVDESDRLVKLALMYPGLLNHEEQKIWRLIRECNALWVGSSRKVENFNFRSLRKYWNQFVMVARDEAGEEILPKAFSPPKSDENEIPF